MSGYIKKGNQWYLNGKLVNAGDQGYDKDGNLNQMQSDGTWKTLKRATAEGKEARKNGLFTPDQYKKWKPKSQTSKERGSLFSRTLQRLGLGETASNVAEMATYLTPAGNFVSLANAGDDFLHGDWKSGLMNAAFALPIIGNAGRLMKVGINTAKLAGKARTARNLKRIANTSDIVGQAAGYGMFGKMGFDIANSVVSGFKQAANTPQYTSSDKNEIATLYNQAKQAGYSDAELMQMMGKDKYNQFKSMMN